jgi:hypothetical protein
LYFEKFTWIQLAIAEKKLKDGKETKDSINKNNKS